MTQTTSSIVSPRIALIDDFRGLAVFLMSIFHFSYDLSVFHFIRFAMDGGFFTWFRFIIVTLFFTSVGAGLFLAHGERIHWRKFWQREVKIAAGALFITLTTYLLYPHSWVWFGVLHFIAVASVLALPMLRWPVSSLILGLAIFLLYNLTDWFNLHFLFVQWYRTLHLPLGTQDLTRLVPWIGMVFIGIYLGSVRFWNAPALPLCIFRPMVNFLSRHSLIFYLIHQGPLFALAWLLNLMFH